MALYKFCFLFWNGNSDRKLCHYVYNFVGFHEHCPCVGRRLHFANRIYYNLCSAHHCLFLNALVKSQKYGRNFLMQLDGLLNKYGRFIHNFSVSCIIRKEYILHFLKYSFLQYLIFCLWFQKNCVRVALILQLSSIWIIIKFYFYLKHWPCQKIFIAMDRKTEKESNLAVSYSCGDVGGRFSETKMTFKFQNLAQARPCGDGPVKRGIMT